METEGGVGTSAFGSRFDGQVDDEESKGFPSRFSEGGSCLDARFCHPSPLPTTTSAFAWYIVEHL